MSGAVSIVIVTVNGFRFVEACVASILASETPDCEIVVVDNGSTDDTPRLLRARFGDRVTVLENGINLGPAAARNRGAARCRGDYLGFLDNDTIVHPAWARAARALLESDATIGAVQCKLLLASDPSRIDYVGEYLGQNGFLVQKAPAGARDEGQYDDRSEILAAKSAGMFIRRSVFEAIGGFDEDYFIYLEETDLGWRTWLQGFRVVLEPGSMVYHHFGGSAVTLGARAVNFNAKFHGCKNYLLTLLKNLGGAALLRILPVHAAAWLGLAVLSLFRGHARAAWWILRGLAWNLVHGRATWRKRRAIQARRRLSDRDLAPRIMRKKPWRYYLDKAITVRRMGYAEGFLRPTPRAAPGSSGPPADGGMHG